MPKKVRFYLFTALTPLVVGVFFVGAFAAKAQTAQPNIVTVPRQEITELEDKTELVSGNPERVVVPSVGIDITVKPGEFSSKDRSWTLSNDAAHYATPTIAPNNIQGNTFIYGHNTKKVFGKLANLEAGAEAFIHTDNGKVFRYTLSYTQTISPNDLSLFEYQGPPMLTLQTCSGLWDERRDLIWFTFQDVR